MNKRITRLAVLGLLGWMLGRQIYQAFGRRDEVESVMADAGMSEEDKQKVRDLFSKFAEPYKW